MAHRIRCRAQWICLISVLLGFPATASAQAGDGGIIILGLLQELNKVVDFSLGFSMARATNTPGSERVIPIGLQFGTTIDVHKSLGIDAELAIQSGKPAGSSDLFNMLSTSLDRVSVRIPGGGRFSATPLPAGCIMSRTAQRTRQPITKATVSLWPMAAVWMSA